MDEAMAPPHKRRKLSSGAAQDISALDNSTVAADVMTPFSHVSHLRTHSSLAPARTHHHCDDEEDQPRVQHAPVGGIEDFKVLLPRQGTGSSASSSEATTPVDSTAGSNGPSPTSPSASTSSASAGGTPASLSPSPSISGSSTISARSSGNGTLSRTISGSSSSVSLNLTTSAIIIIGESTTTLKTTITLGGSTSSITDTDASFLYLATLFDGDVSTLTRSSIAYTTAFGTESFTVPSRTSARTSTVEETVSADSSRSGQSTVTSIATVGIAGAGSGRGSPTNSSPATSSTDSSSNNDNHNDNTPPAGTIAGGVVGGCAGLAVVLLIAMLFVRWYRRKARTQHQALPPGSMSAPGDDQTMDRNAPGMAERAGLRPLVAAIPGLMRHQNRSTEASEPSERGFTRVSGRKLPSAFSEGMTSDGLVREQPPPAMPLSGSPPDAERSLSGNSFYRDSTGFYGGDGDIGLARSSSSPTSPNSNAPIHGKAPELMMGPQRQPQVHAGGPYNMTPTSADSPHAATFGRSETPDLRNSRFTEDM
ncbi:hypothetical protein CLAFUR0_00341 [Fulvia fulva]|nr:hypothetical protein CLAFUR0_00341 [Fulvia fulva]